MIIVALYNLIYYFCISHSAVRNANIAKYGENIRYIDISNKNR
jgi:hypothetical protein